MQEPKIDTGVTETVSVPVDETAPMLTEKQVELLNNTEPRKLYLGGRGAIGSGLAAAALLAESATRTKSSLFHPPQIKFGKQVARLRPRRVTIKSKSIYSPHSSLLQQIKGLKPIWVKHTDALLRDENSDTAICSCESCVLYVELSRQYAARKANRVTA